jgi:hypothetical protein
LIQPYGSRLIDPQAQPEERSKLAWRAGRANGFEARVKPADEDFSYPDVCFLTSEVDFGLQLLVSRKQQAGRDRTC